MLPSFGLTEFIFLAVVALIVVGPKDLPIMMRRLGQFVAKAKSMAREFQGAFDDIAKQAELEELRQEIEDLKRNNALTEAQDSFKAVEKDINDAVMRETPKPETKAVGKGADKAPAPAQTPKTAPEADTS